MNAHQIAVPHRPTNEIEGGDLKPDFPAKRALRVGREGGLPSVLSNRTVGNENSGLLREALEPH